MASNDLDMRNIGFQDQLRSKPVRLNFRDVETEFNALRSEVQAGIASTASEVTSARDNQDSLSDNIHLRSEFGNRITATTDFQSTIGTTGLTVRILSGNGIIDGRGVDISATVSATTGLPAASMKRKDLLIIDSTNTVSILKGSEVNATGAVVYPALSDTEEVLHSWTIFDTTSTLSITDERQRLLDPFHDQSYSNFSFSFVGDTVSTVTLQNSRGEQNFYVYNFSGDTLSSASVLVNGITNVITYTFSGDTISTITNTIRN